MKKYFFVLLPIASCSVLSKSNVNDTDLGKASSQVGSKPVEGSSVNENHLDYRKDLGIAEIDSSNLQQFKEWVETSGYFPDADSQARFLDVVCRDYKENISKKCFSKVVQMPWPALVEALCKSGVDVNQLITIHSVENVCGVQKGTGLDLAAYTNNIPMAEILLQYGAHVDGRSWETPPDVDKRPWHLKTSLHWAARKGYVDMMRLLRRHGANINIKDEMGVTPLSELIEYVIENRNDQKAFDYLIQIPSNALNGTTLLHHVVTHTGAHVIVQSLMSQLGININAKDSEGNTPIHKATKCRDEGKTIRILVNNYQANLNAQNNKGDTPMHKAAEHGNVAAIQTLYDLGANLNIQNNEGHSPLHIAVGCAKEAVAQQLKSLGININLRNKDGKTALDLAKSELARLEKESEASQGSSSGDLNTKIDNMRAIIEIFIPGKYELELRLSNFFNQLINRENHRPRPL